MEDIIKDLEADLQKSPQNKGLQTFGQKAIALLVAAYALTTDDRVKSLEDKNSALVIELNQAKDIAKDALANFNKAAEGSSNDFTATIKGGKKVKINFGVDHNGTAYTAAELSKNPTIVSELLDLGSGAVETLED